MVSTVEAIMDCVNRDIMIVTGSELLTDLQEWWVGVGAVLNGVICACLIMLVSHSDRGVQNVVDVSHFPLLLICSAAYYSRLAAVEMVFEFILSSATICSKSNSFPSFTLTKTMHVCHSCLAMLKQTTLANTAVCSVLMKTFDNPTAIQDCTSNSWGYQRLLN